MTWTKLSDDFTDDCWRLSDAAFRLHVEALVWSNRKLLDLVIDSADLNRFGAKSARIDEAVAELVESGWWEPTDTGFRIVHHGVYQRTAEAVLNQQKANHENGRKGGRPAGPPRERAPRKRTPETDSLTDSLTDSVSTSSDADVQETHSLTETETDSPTERDGTGIDEATIYESEGHDVVTPNWKSKMIPNAVCPVCDRPFTSPDPERFTVCPVQDDAHARARAA